MAGIHRHPRSRYWYASFKREDGGFGFRSTRQTNRSKAMFVALEFERASRLARDGLLTEAHCRKVLSVILERTRTEAASTTL